jgi:hypothetical protein
MRLGIDKNSKLRPFNPSDAYNKKTPRLMRTSVILPSQQQAFAVCTEVILEWFLDKYKENYFNSVYVDGTHSFDEFRKLSKINQQMRKTNPLLALVPNIDPSYNRDWIDSTPEIPMLLRRSRFEGVFLSDVEHNKGLHLQIIFKTIKMNFTFKMRLDTRAQQLDMMEFIKVKHRAGWSETLTKDMDIHVPKGIISQIAFDNGFDLEEGGNPKNPMELLGYLNTHSLIPFMYKLRCSTGNNEYFIKVPNCTVHIKSELPTMDEGERNNSITTNYNIEFPLEVEMTAPYCYTYFSQKDDHRYLNTNTMYTDNALVAIMQASLTTIPPEDENHWALLTPTEYGIDEADIGKPLDIDFKELFNGTEIGMVLDYTQKIAVSPAVFLNFMMFNNSKTLKYTMDWGKMIAHIDEGITVDRTIIGIYVDMKYVNDTIILIKELDKKSDRV